MSQGSFHYDESSDAQNHGPIRQWMHPHTSSEFPLIREGTTYTGSDIPVHISPLYKHNDNTSPTTHIPHTHHTQMDASTTTSNLDAQDTTSVAHTETTIGPFSIRLTYPAAMATPPVTLFIDTSYLSQTPLIVPTSTPLLSTPVASWIGGVSACCSIFLSPSGFIASDTSSSPHPIEPTEPTGPRQSTEQPALDWNASSEPPNTDLNVADTTQSQQPSQSLEDKTDTKTDTDTDNMTNPPAIPTEEGREIAHHHADDTLDADSVDSHPTDTDPMDADPIVEGTISNLYETLQRAPRNMQHVVCCKKYIRNVALIQPLIKCHVETLVLFECFLDIPILALLLNAPSLRRLEFHHCRLGHLLSGKMGVNTSMIIERGRHTVLELVVDPKSSSNTKSILPMDPCLWDIATTIHLRNVVDFTLPITMQNATVINFWNCDQITIPTPTKAPNLDCIILRQCKNIDVEDRRDWQEDVHIHATYLYCNDIITRSLTRPRRGL